MSSLPWCAVILGVTSPGDGVVIQPPVYHPFALRIVANGRRVVENPLVCTGEAWEMDLDGLERVIDAGTRLLILCSPHNPVAKVWSAATLQRLAELCARKGIVIVSDEIHHDLVMPGFPPRADRHPPGSGAHHGHPHRRNEDLQSCRPGGLPHYRRG